VKNSIYSGFSGILRLIILLKSKQAFVTQFKSRFKPTFFNQLTALLSDMGFTTFTPIQEQSFCHQ